MNSIDRWLKRTKSCINRWLKGTKFTLWDVVHLHAALLASFAQVCEGVGAAHSVSDQVFADFCAQNPMPMQVRLWVLDEADRILQKARGRRVHWLLSVPSLWACWYEDEDLKANR